MVNRPDRTDETGRQAGDNPTSSLFALASGEREKKKKRREVVDCRANHVPGRLGQYGVSHASSRGAADGLFLAATGLKQRTARWREAGSS